MDQTSPSPVRAYLAVLLICVVWAAQSFLPGEDDGYDLRAYWSAARVVSEGGDPYRLENLTRVLPGSPPSAFLNPPQILLLVGFLGNLPFEEAETLWWLASISIFALSAVIVMPQRGMMSIAPRAVPLWAGCLSTFLPVTVALRAGQVTPLVALGLALIMSALRDGGGRGGRSWSLVAGLLLTSIKPQLAWLLYLYVALRVIPSRGFPFAGALAAGGLIWIVLPVLVAPGIYADMLEIPPPAALEVKMPVISAFLVDLDWERGTAVMAGLLLGLCALWTCLRREDALLYLVPLGLVTAPYGWHYDHAVLVPIITSLALTRGGRAAAGILVMNALLVVSPRDVHFSVWYPVALALVAYATRDRERRVPREESQEALRAAD